MQFTEFDEILDRILEETEIIDARTDSPYASITMEKRINLFELIGEFLK